MRAAITLWYVVGEAEHIFVVALIPPHRHFDGDAVLFTADGDRLVDQRLLGAVKVLDESLKTAVVEHFFLPDVGMTLVGKQDADAGVQERELAQAMLQRAIVEFRHGEGFGAWHEADFSAGLAAGIAGHLQRRVGDAVRKAHFIDLALTADLQLQPDGQCVDDGDADAVQTAGDLVGILVELTAGMQLGHDDFSRRDAFTGMDIRRDAATVVGDRHRTIRIERDGDEIGIAAERFVDGVVDDFVNHVMQTGTIIRVADVHAGTLAHGIKTFQDLDAVCAILGIAVVFGYGYVGHLLKSFQCFREHRRSLTNQQFFFP